ncbi:MAG: hypothetical protein ACREQ5_33985, partial [Candidatus Dormibacteria bacterium]
ITRICNFANTETLLQMYKTYILTIIEYCNHIYYPNITQIKKLESIQRYITRYICYKNGKIDLNYIKRLEYLKLKPLLVRKQSKVLKIIFQIIHNFNDIQNNWKNKLTLIKSRNGYLIKNNYYRINFCDNNMFVMGVKLFNSLLDL